MMLNALLDEYAKDTNIEQVIARGVIGNGTGTPAVTDTAMFAEVATFTSDGGFAVVNDHSSSEGSNYIEYKFTDYRVYQNTTGSGINVTEIGLKSDNNVLIYHDLTRTDPLNPASAPVTLTVEDDEEFQIIFTCTLVLDWAINSSTIFCDDGSGGVGLAGKDAAGNFDVNHALYLSSTTSLSSLVSFFHPCDSQASGAAEHNATNSLMRMQAQLQDNAITRTSGITGSSILASGVSLIKKWLAYTDGNHYRDLFLEANTASLNDPNIYTIFIGIISTTQYGYYIDYTNPTSFPKVDIQKMSFTLRVSWSFA